MLQLISYTTPFALPADVYLNLNTIYPGAFSGDANTNTTWLPASTRAQGDPDKRFQILPVRSQFAMQHAQHKDRGMRTSQLPQSWRFRFPQPLRHMQSLQWRSASNAFPARSLQAACSSIDCTLADARARAEHPFIIFRRLHVSRMGLAHRRSLCVLPRASHCGDPRVALQQIQMAG